MTEKDIVYLLPDLKYGKFITRLLHTPEYSCYNPLRLIQGAVEFERRIPKYYIEKEEYYYVARDFKIGLTKNDARALREEFINEIVRVILEVNKTDRDEEMLHDHYARLFHALSILKVPKNTELLPGTTKNLVYDSMYMLWLLDDGSKEMFHNIESIAWYMAEEAKKRSGKRNPKEDDNLLLGIRHQTGQV